MSTVDEGTFTVSWTYHGDPFAVEIPRGHRANPGVWVEVIQKAMEDGGYRASFGIAGIGFFSTIQICGPLDDRIDIVLKDWAPEER